MSDVTRLLEAAVAAGDCKAAADLIPLVYDDLRKLAAARMAAENPGHTLDATALVHEAYLRLTGAQSFESRSHFMRAAAEAMRRILVDHARARNAAKRGAGRRVEFDSELLAAPAPDEALEALDESLSHLAAENPKLAELVQLRFFGGLTLEQTAEILGISARTADTWWAYARAWLAIDCKKS
jgi:RNA polymerase sigma factor (TIGR02999 family)